MAHGILDEVGNHLVHLGDMARFDGIAVVEPRVDHNARKAVEEHDHDEAEPEEHQGSPGMTQGWQ